MLTDNVVGVTETELRARLAELAQARKAAMIAYDVERVLEIRAEVGRLTAEIHRLHREQRSRA